MPGRGSAVLTKNRIDLLQSVRDLLVELLEIRDDSLPLRLHVRADWLALPVVGQVGTTRPTRQELILAARRAHLVLLTATYALLLLLARLARALHLLAAGA